MPKEGASPRSPSPATRTERAFAVLVLLACTGAFFNLLPGQESTSAGPAGNLGMRLLWMALYVCVLFLLIRHCKGFLRALVGEPWLLALLVLAFLSMAWSQAPGITLRRSVALLGTYLCAVYFAMRYDLRTQLRLLAWALGLGALFSLPFGVFGIGSCPNSALDAGGGWCGVYAQKNGLGAAMALAALVFIMLARLEKKRKWKMFFFAGLSFALILLSHSKTSLVVFLALLIAVPYSGLLHGRLSHATAAAGFAILAGGAGLYWTFHHLMGVTALLGKNATLTGRLQLWILSFVMALRRPWLGYGYNAFWLGYAGPSARVVRVLGWLPFYAHDGLLELWLDVGLVGVLLFVAGFAIYTSRALRFFRGHREVEYVWPLMFLAFMFLTNLTESSLLAPNDLSWLLYVAVALLVSPSFARIAGRATPVLPVRHG